MPRAGYAVVHFLEQNNIRLIVTDGFHDPLGAIEAVYAANPLVDVAEAVGDFEQVVRQPNPQRRRPHTDEVPWIDVERLTAVVAFDAVRRLPRARSQFGRLRLDDLPPKAAGRVRVVTFAQQPAD